MPRRRNRGGTQPRAATPEQTGSAPARTPEPPGNDTATTQPSRPRGARSDPSAAGPREPSGLVALGRNAWALLGIALLIGGAVYLVGQVMLLVVPLVLALFPAALLEPVSRWLKEHRVPPALASLLTIVGSLALLGGIIAALVPLVIAEMPQLIETGEQGLQDLQGFIERDPFGLGIGGTEQLLSQAQDLIGQAGDYTGQALQAAATVVGAATGAVFLLVALFFYLKDDRQIASGVGDLLPPRIRPDASEIATRVWDTLGKFFRGQLLVAFVDAVLIGLGLLILQIPLALPLAVLIFFGALFPIIGAFLTGTLAVLVALADGGLVLALIVLGLILGVQQLEGNVLQPIVLGRVISLHPLLVIVAVTGGALTLGVLGAFLAVPVVASLARVVEYLRERQKLHTSESQRPGEGGEGGSGDEASGAQSTPEDEDPSDGNGARERRRSRAHRS